MDIDKLSVKLSPRRRYDALKQCRGGVCCICGEIPLKKLSCDMQSAKIIKK